MSARPARRRLAIVVPVLDDWVSFCMLVKEISGRFSRDYIDIDIDIVAIDDGSQLKFLPEQIELPVDGAFINVEILHLSMNLGHQRAIAVGLLAIADRNEHTHVAVMDGDGEDRPEDLAALLERIEQGGDQIVLAQRGLRSEGLGFRMSYLGYKALFRLLTGRRIDFGNFSLLRMDAVRRIVHMPDIWNHYAATVARSRIPVVKLRAHRGRRYAGSSQMNYHALVVHGLSAISVFSDMTFVRVLVASVALLVVLGAGMTGVIAIRLFTELAIPGWSTSALGFLAVLFMRETVLLMSMTLFSLSRRSESPPPPLRAYRDYIATRSCFTYSPNVASAAE